MTDELALPRWAYWADGRSALVHTRDAYDALPPGHVPWPGVFPQPWPPVPGTVATEAPPVDAGPSAEDLAAARARLEEGTRLPLEAAHADLGPDIPDLDSLPDGGGRVARRRGRPRKTF